MSKTILCITSYFKGEAFLTACKQAGCRVILMTEEKLRDADWPHESIDEIFLMPDLARLPDVIYAVSYLYRSQWIDAIVPLDEYDVEMAAILREHIRLPGLTFTQTKRFRDKLAMRDATAAAGIRVPPYIAVLNHAQVTKYAQQVAPPWVLKPRLEAGAMGIKKAHTTDELWHWINELGDQQSFRVLEQFIPGDVYHVDTLVNDEKILFSSFQRYGAPPMNVAHEGGVFITRTLAQDDPDVPGLTEMNAQVISALGLARGATHAEFIKAHDSGEFYFLEIAARVGGAHIADLVEAATGVNLWAEWARLEIAHLRGETYALPKFKRRHAALLVTLSRQEHPDMGSYDDAEVVWRINKKQHAGLIVASETRERVDALLQAYQVRFVEDFLAVAPPREHPPD